MRIISGSKRGMNLQTPEGLGTRPTSDRIKETLFNMISFDIPDCRFLDLFSGSGQMGIEALSRGASEAVFVEKDKSAISCIVNNLSKAKFTDEATLYKEDVFSALNKLNGSEEFDFVFMDPPYNKLIEKQVLESLANKSYISSETTIIVEASLETDIDYVSELGYTITKEKLYKTNKHIFLKKA
ncbi:16S rRNA (guanine(966)-N(2))-methyltransferase RsmD [Pseudobutyrivibrio ruminis]|uniref:16S rRNA (guanine(966)-N(2))-methyltransferase RsmD n=1 Tax=Pseudobutyrivibrio ruminis TaxID=46206 RepID=UPI00051BC8FC